MGNCGSIKTIDKLGMQKQLMVKPVDHILKDPIQRIAKLPINPLRTLLLV